MVRSTAFFLKTACWLLVLLSATAARAETMSEATDVRILVDISGSMVQTDPQNRRTPALNLLVDSLPEGSRAGVWSFGRYVNLLVDHDTVNGAWRSTARDRIGDLRAIAQRTNLGAALDDAAYDFGYSTYEPPTDVILITDGQVDIAPNAGVNQIERDRILNTVIPRFAQAGARIHTLALTDAADSGLLEQMSSRTNGVFQRVDSPNDIRDFILSVLSSVNPGNELPLDNSGFEVDSQVSEVTALVLHDQGQIELRSPNGSVSSALNPGRQQWRVGDGYTLVTVNDPATGRWQIDGAVESGSRVSVVSDLNLEWNRPEGSVVVRNQPILIELKAVDQNGRPVASDLTGVMEPSLKVNGQAVSLLRWQNEMLKAQLPNRYEEGPLEFEVSVDAGTFQRLVRRTVQNRPALSSEVLVLGQGYQWRLYPSHRDLRVEGGTLEAQVSGPGGERSQPFERHASGYYFVNLSGDRPRGDYRLTAEGRLTINDQPLSSLGVAPVTLTLPVSADQPRILTLEAAPMAVDEPMEEPEMMPEPDPETMEPFVKEPMPEFQEITADITVAEPAMPSPQEEQPTPAMEEEGPGWVTYLLYSLPGLLTLVAFFVGYRLLEKRTKGKPEAEPKAEAAAAEQDLDDQALNDIEDLDLAAGVNDDKSEAEWEPDSDLPEAPIVDEVVADEEEPPPPDRTEAPRVDMEDSLDTSLLDQEDWGELDSNSNEADSDDDDLFDISNIDESLSDLEDLSLDEDDDPFASLDDDDEEEPKKNS